MVETIWPDVTSFMDVPKSVTSVVDQNEIRGQFHQYANALALLFHQHIYLHFIHNFERKLRPTFMLCHLHQRWSTLFGSRSTWVTNLVFVGQFKNHKDFLNLLFERKWIFRIPFYIVKMNISFHPSIFYQNVFSPKFFSTEM